MAAKSYGFFVIVLIFLSLSLAIVYYLVKVRFSGSELFWYGAIAGFFGCLFLVFLALAVYIAFKVSYESKKNTLQSKLFREPTISIKLLFTFLTICCIIIQYCSAIWTSSGAGKVILLKRNKRRNC